MFPKVVYTDDVTVINAQNLNDIQDAIIQHDAKADQDGYYEDMTVGMAEELVGTTFTEDDTPYQFRKSGGGVEVGAREYLEKLVGGSLGWNQMIPTTGASKTDAGVTFTNNGDGTWRVTGTSTAATVFANLDYVANTTKYISGHVYFIGGIGSNVNIQIVASGTYASITATGQTIQKFSASSITASWARLHVATSGTTVNTTVTPQILDLTQMFGSTIADYIYSLEQATAGAGVAWLSQYIGLGTYHAYDAGSIQSVQATAHVTTGKNLLDVTNETSGSNAHIREYNLPDLPLGTYTVSAKCVSTASTNCAALFIYKDGTNTASPMLTNGSWSSQTFNLTKPVKTLRIYSSNGYATSQSNTIEVSSAQLEFGSTATAYEPYTAHTYPLGSDTLRGYPMLVNNKLAFDGDEKAPDGTITRKYGIVDLGSLTWTYQSSTGMFYSSGYADMKAGTIKGIVSNGYKLVSGTSIVKSTDKTICKDSNGRLYAHDSAYSTTAAFQTAISGTYMVYEKNSETSESSTAYQRIQPVDPNGAEQFVCTTPVPVGHYTQYPKDLWSTLDKLADIFTPPTANGTYTLKVTVNNGVATYRWVAG